MSLVESVNPEVVWQTFQQHKENSENFLDNIGDDPVTRNAAITNVYSELSVQSLAFLRLSLGALVSGTVGRNMELTGKIDGITAGQLEAANVIDGSFPGGNQKIFTDIIPLFQTYQNVNIAGIHQGEII